MTIDEIRDSLTLGCSGPFKRCSSFGLAGRSQEVHLFIEPQSRGSFEEQLEEVTGSYHRALAARGLPRHSAVFRRLFLSDAANQLETVLSSPLGHGVPTPEQAAVSCVEQPPLSRAKIALLAYHMADVEPEQKVVLPLPAAGPHARTLLLHRGPQRHLWTTQMTAVGPNSAAQTTALFRAYRDMLRSRDASLLSDVLRTWLFVENVDANYQGLVDARRELFLAEGLTPRTHYLVSTGIEGRTEHAERQVMMDAFAIQGLEPAQVHYLDSLDHLNRTDDYGVTFERAVRLDHADRSHTWLAGTASIDAHGNVLHEGDVVAQVQRTLENMQALLEAGGTNLDHVASMIVYLRDSADAERVTRILDDTRPNLPHIAVRAPVCRPTWLVEIEALAISPNDDPSLPAF